MFQTFALLLLVTVISQSPSLQTRRSVWRRERRFRANP